jgi:anaerobic carbon-monoxide dehydrogenase iron sulfur subunit
MLKALVIDPGKCTGCKQCEMACSYENENEFNVAKSRIRVFDFHEEGKMVPYTCTQCAEAWCQQACPVNAITTDPLSLVKVVHENLCVGCKVCTIACPFGTINYNASTGKVIKCDLCQGNPACADACPTEAITFQDIEQTGFGGTSDITSGRQSSSRQALEPKSQTTLNSAQHGARERKRRDRWDGHVRSCG